MDWNNVAQVGQALFWVFHVYLFFHGYTVGNRMI